MKKNSAHIMSGIAVLFFFFSTILCPIEILAKPKRHASKQETEIAEKNDEVKEAPENVKKSDPQQETDASGEAVKSKGTEKDETEGIPTRDFKDEDFKPTVDEESSAWMFIKMLLVLGIFAGGFYYFYRFVTKKAGVSIFGGEAIKVLSVVPLGQNKFLQVVDLAGKVLVIGVSDNSINLISEITDKDQADRVRMLSTRTPPPGAGGGGFQDYIVREIGKIIGRVREFRHRDGRFKAAAGPPEDIDYLRQQRNRLKDLNGLHDE